MSPSFRVLSTSLLVLCLTASAAHADRRYFVQSYTPYTPTEGTLELETITIARSGQAGTDATGWRNRIEFEYGMTDRLMCAAYLNFVQSPEAGAASRFDGPSFEFIYALAERGRLAVDPAAYFEVRANGSELELEPKLLLARRLYRLVGVLNVTGEFERITAGDEKGETEKAVKVSAGLSRELGRRFALGVESHYERELLDETPDAARWLLGPTLNVQTPRIQMALGWHWQVHGTPASSGSLNLADFPRSEVRLILGVDL